MADAVSTTVVQDGSRFYVAQFTNTSDGSGESAVTKIDVSALAANNKGEACTGVRINKIWWRTVGMSVRVLYDATSDVAAWDCKIQATSVLKVLMVFLIMQVLVKLGISSLPQQAIVVEISML